MGKCRKLKLGCFEIMFQEEVPSNFVLISAANNLQCNSAMADFENRNIFSARKDLICACEGAGGLNILMWVVTDLLLPVPVLA